MRAFLAVAMLVGFFVIVLGLVLGLGTLTVLGFTVGHSAAAGIKAGFFTLVVVAALGGALYKAIRLRQEPEGVPLTRAGQPELWRVVDELAVVAGTRSPDDIRLVPEVNAAVWEKTGWLGLKPGPRYLMIGLPLLAGLSVGELRSVLAHELGHYGGGHTTLSALTYRAKNALALTVDNLGDNVLRRPLGWYAKLYAMVAASANRAQELSADQASVTAAGRATAQSALRRLPSLAAAWNGYHRDYVSLALDAGRTPQVLGGFRAFLDDPTRGAELGALQDRLVDEQAKSVFDSHPPIRERVAAMEALPSPDVPADDRPAWVLVAGVPELERGMVRGDLGPVADWPEIVARAGATHVARYARVLSDAGVEAGVGGTLDSVLDALEQGRLEALRPHVLRPEVQHDREALVEVVTELLAATVVHELVSSGRASIVVNWGGPWRLVTADGTPVDESALVAPAVRDPGAVPDVRARIRDLRDGVVTA
ncbi:M48 family metallopeptidase [Actinosynnema sp. NPDC020468]|uniref:M48 family metallopeptidase n=1 Tax=Actinosynnema sp. NPDC020468 TaxID=3154488 RepID=UPI0033CC1DB9